MQKPARSPAFFFFPFRPATVTQTWLLFAQALTRKHINTISCSTGSNPHTCAKNTNVRTQTHMHTNQYMLPHPSAPFDTKSALSPLAPFSLLVMARAQMDSADAPSTEGGADTHTVLVSQPVQLRMRPASCQVYTPCRYCADLHLPLFQACLIGVKSLIMAFRMYPIEAKTVTYL